MTTLDQAEFLKGFEARMKKQAFTPPPPNPANQVKQPTVQVGGGSAAPQAPAPQIQPPTNANTPPPSAGPNPATFTPHSLPSAGDWLHHPIDSLVGTAKGVYHTVNDTYKNVQRLNHDIPQIVDQGKSMIADTQGQIDKLKPTVDTVANVNKGLTSAYDTVQHGFDKVKDFAGNAWNNAQSGNWGGIWENMKANPWGAGGAGLLGALGVGGLGMLLSKLFGGGGGNSNGGGGGYYTGAGPRAMGREVYASDNSLDFDDPLIKEALADPELQAYINTLIV